MDPFKKLIVSIVAFVAVVAGGYYLLKQDKLFDYVFPSGEFGDAAKRAVLNVRDKITGLADPIVNKLTGKAQQAVDQVVDTAKEKAFDSVKDSVAKKLDEIGKDLGVKKTPINGAALMPGAPAQPSRQEEKIPIGFSVRRGAPAIFTISNPPEIAGTINYTALWGDDKKDVGEVIENSSKALLHIWEKTGQFEVSILLVSGGTTKTYKFQIIVTD